MRAFRRLTTLSAIAASAGLLLASGAATAASAQPAARATPAASVQLRGGHTTVTTGRGTAAGSCSST